MGPVHSAAKLGRGQAVGGLLIRCVASFTSVRLIGGFGRNILGTSDLLRTRTHTWLAAATFLAVLLCSPVSAEESQTCKQQFAAVFAEYSSRFNTTNDYSGYLQKQFNSSDFGACILSPYNAGVEIVIDEQQGLVDMLQTYAQAVRQQPSSSFSNLQLASFSNIENFIIKHFNASDSATIKPNGYIYDTRSLGVLRITNTSVLRELSDVLASQPGQDLVQQEDLLRFVTNVSIKYKGKPVALPFDGDILLLYYRQDAFTTLGLSVPNTWEELISVASRLQQDKPEGITYPFCFGGCKSLHLLVALAGQFIQYNSTLSGFFYDPYANLTTLVANDGMAEAMKLFSQLQKYMPPAASSCEEVDSEFVAGNCGMTLGWGSTFKAIERSDRSAVRGQVWTSELPGSNRVFDRQTQQLQECTMDLCPYSTVHPAGQGTMIVNRAAYAPVNPFTGSHLLSGNAFGNNASEQAVTSIQFLMHLTSPEVSLQFVLDPLSDIDPFRTSHLSKDVWAFNNYSANASEMYLAAVNASLSTPNVVAPLRLPIWHDVDTALKATVFEITTQSNPSFRAMANALGDRLTGILYNSSISWQNLADMYNGTMGHKESMYDQPSNSGGNQSMSLIPAIVIPALLVVFLIVGTSVAVMYIRRDRRRSVLGRIMAPSAGPDTSLVITDIQDSTAMWEALPSEVMDRAVKEHHKCVRKYLQKHYGYESTTEGDSFILAFHTAKDALLFAMDVQTALMKIDWPPEVLALDWCSPVYANELKSIYFDPTKLDTPHVDFDGAEQQQQPVMPDKSVDVFTWMLGAIKAKEGNVAEVTKQELQAYAPELVGCYTLRKLLQTTWKETDASDPAKMLIFRGMRVRIGMHTGVTSESHVQRNQTDSRVHYTGDSMQLAKYVSDAAQGAMVTISEATYQKLPMEELFEKLQVVHCGEHHLSDDLPLVYIYQMLPRPLMGRLAFLGGIRSKMAHAPSTLDAPMGRITIVFMNIVGVQMLLSWNSEVTKHAIKMFHRVAGEELRKLNGHQVEQANNLFLASFPCQYQAVLWCLETQQRLKKTQWPQELINRELDQEDLDAAALGGDAQPAEANTTVYRGLHSKAGIDYSDVRGYINPITGRITYRGKVMNRAARIASMAQKDEVLCSHEVFYSLRETTVVGNTHRDHDLRQALASVEGESRGMQRLKGVADKMEIFLCHYKPAYGGMGMSRRASALGPPQDVDLLYHSQQVERVLSSASFIHRAAAHFGQMPPDYLTGRPFMQADDTMVHEPQQLLLTDADLQAISGANNPLLAQPELLGQPENIHLPGPPTGVLPDFDPKEDVSIQIDALERHLNMTISGAEIQMQPMAPMEHSTSQ